MDEDSGFGEAAIRVAILIPTFNNCRTLKSVIEDVLKHCNDVLVVDDGCTDETSEILNSFGERILRHRNPENRGKGYSLREGFRILHEAGFHYAIAIDADGQHFGSDIPGFLEAIKEAKGGLFVGQRDMKAIGAPRKSLFGLWFSNMVLKRLGGIVLDDSQSGFRAYPLASIAKLDLRGERYDLELEVLVKGAWAGLKILPVPIACSYTPEGGRVSHFRPVRDFCQIAMQMIRLLLQKR